MEGTNLESTGKYSELEECVSELENAIDQLQGFSVDDVDSISSTADELDSACDEASGVSFPGMYG